MKIRELLNHLNDTKGATSDDDARTKAALAVEHTREFITIFERSSGSRVAGGERIKLARHLKGSHVEAMLCRECPYFDVLAPWRSLLPSTSLWMAWAQREQTRSDRPALWSAFKTLYTYLSLQGEGLKPGTKFSIVDSGDRRLLGDGNNRVRLLAAMGHEELDVELSSG